MRIALVVDALPAWGETACAALEWISNLVMFTLLAWFGVLASLGRLLVRGDVALPGAAPQVVVFAWLPVCSGIIVLRLVLMLAARRRAA